MQQGEGGWHIKDGGYPIWEGLGSKERVGGDLKLGGIRGYLVARRGWVVI